MPARLAQYIHACLDLRLRRAKRAAPIRADQPRHQGHVATGRVRDEWDVAYERLELEWRAAYTAAFVEIAVARGWRREDAGTWPIGIGDEAFIEAYLYDWDPRRAAPRTLSLVKSQPTCPTGKPQKSRPN